MRTILLFNNLSAAIAQTSEILDFQSQDARFLIQIKGTDFNGTPRIYVEESIDETIWTGMEDTSTWLDYFDHIDQAEVEAGVKVIAIKDNYFMGKYFRLRMIPNDNTTGTIWAKIGYKTKP